MQSEIPLCTSHGAEPFGASELACRGKAFTVFAFKHWKWEEKKQITEYDDAYTYIEEKKPHNL